MTDETRDPHVLAPGRAPTPFTADEIRAGCPTGRTIRLRVDVVGETAFHRVSRFVECDQAGATMEHSRLSLDGSPLAEPEVDRVTWRDLQAHASFAADRHDDRVRADRDRDRRAGLPALYGARRHQRRRLLVRQGPARPAHPVPDPDGRPGRHDRLRGGQHDPVSGGVRLRTVAAVRRS